MSFGIAGHGLPFRRLLARAGPGGARLPPGAWTRPGGRNRFHVPGTPDGRGKPRERQLRPSVRAVRRRRRWRAGGGDAHPRRRGRHERPVHGEPRLRRGVHRQQAVARAGRAPRRQHRRLHDARGTAGADTGAERPVLVDCPVDRHLRQAGRLRGRRGQRQRRRHHRGRRGHRAHGRGHFRRGEPRRRPRRQRIGRDRRAQRPRPLRAVVERIDHERAHDHQRRRRGPARLST